jgi:hypothetical protein
VTLLPAPDFGIKGHPGKPYDVNQVCAHPECRQPSRHAHHLWSRSYLRGQPYEWIRLPDGTVIGNRVGLCVEHHDNVTGEIGGYKARIAFDGGLFWWEDKIRYPAEGQKMWWRVGPLDPQPPGATVATVVTAEQGADTCPTCGHTKRQRRPETPGERRKSRTWILDVPDDAEIGTDVLDEWIDSFAEVLGYTDERSRLRRYHTLAVVLSWASVNQTTFQADWAEAMSE